MSFAPRTARLLSATAAVVLSASVASAQNNLQSILAQMDQASAKFHSASANLRYDNYTRVVRDHTVQTGNMVIERNGNSQSFGAALFDAGSKSPARIVNYDGGTLQLYTPGTNQDDVFKAGGNQARYESFLTLGFGGSGKALSAAWNINDQGSETIEGTRVEKLDLVSKDQSVKDTFTHVTIWVDPARAVSLRQIFYAPNGDTRTADYTDIKVNGPVNRKPYTVPSKAQRIPH